MRQRHNWVHRPLVKWRCPLEPKPETSSLAIDKAAGTAAGGASNSVWQLVLWSGNSCGFCSSETFAYTYSSNCVQTGEACGRERLVPGQIITECLCASPARFGKSGAPVSAKPQPLDDEFTKDSSQEMNLAPEPLPAPQIADVGEAEVAYRSRKAVGPSTVPNEDAYQERMGQPRHRGRLHKRIRDISYWLDYLREGDRLRDTEERAYFELAKAYRLRGTRLGNQILEHASSPGKPFELSGTKDVRQLQ